MKKYLFLDIDGVLVNRNSLSKKKWLEDGREIFNEGCVELLNSIVQQTDCYIIITSAWRKRCTLDELKSIFKLRGFKYSDKIIDKTIEIYSDAATAKHNWIDIPRGTEIRQWLMTYVVDTGSFKKSNVDYTYGILDDSVDMLYEHRNNFVNTDFNIGLTKEDSEKIVKILNNDNNG